jgi:hypothetical protein
MIELEPPVNPDDLFLVEAEPIPSESAGDDEEEAKSRPVEMVEEAKDFVPENQENDHPMGTRKTLDEDNPMLQKQDNRPTMDPTENPSNTHN